ncbi:MAG: glucokinase [Xanthobacteraceae bacterium]
MTAAASRSAVLLADIGGTNARFALLAGGTVGTVTHMAVGDHGSFGAALSAYLGSRKEAGTIGAAIVAASGVVRDGRCRLTNNPWVIDAAELRAACGFSTVRLINDFEAVAWSLPALSGDKLLQVGGGQPVAGAARAAGGPGTGLGMALSNAPASGHHVLASEGGHATMAGGSLREDAVIAELRRRFGHVSAERVLSGGGLENLHDALAALDNVKLPRRRAAEITRAGIEGSCPTSRAAVEMFCAMLGTVAGNLALMLGARGGIFIGGGILRHMPGYFANSPFRARFEQKGRFSTHLEPIPVYLILDEDAAFAGLRALAEVEGIG